MSDDFTTRRNQLAAEIARQRGELARAYLNLEKPIHYAEYGMRGLGFIRNNPWIFAAVPALFSIGRTVFGGKKKRVSKTLPGQEQNQTGKKTRPLQVWGSRVWQLYQFYRRVRHFLP
jgi:hypothetical protein